MVDTELSEHGAFAQHAVEVAPKPEVDRATAQLHREVVLLVLALPPKAKLAILTHVLLLHLSAELLSLLLQLLLLLLLQLLLLLLLQLLLLLLLQLLLLLLLQLLLLLLLQLQLLLLLQLQHVPMQDTNVLIGLKLVTVGPQLTTPT